MSAESLWIGIDLGTQSVRALAADESGSVWATASEALLSDKRSGNRHTQNPDEWWAATCACCRDVMSKIPREAVRGLAVDATSGTLLLTDEHLRPVSDALMYDDGRAEAEAAQVAEAGQQLWAELGYRMQPSWALPRLLWLWRQADGKTRASSPRLTHQNDFIHQRLAGARLASDSSHSLKSGYDLRQLRWPFEIFSAAGLPETLFPEVVVPGSPLGNVSKVGAAETGLPAGLPIFAGMTDGCAAQIAAGALDPGSWNSVLGTTLVLKGVTIEPLRDPLGVVYSHRAADGKWLPGGASSTGAGLIAQHFRSSELDALGASAAKDGPSDLVIYPLPSVGERFPFAAPAAEGFSLREPRDSAELYRAILQGVAFIERLCFDYLDRLGAPTSGSFSISGGAARSPLWNQIRADVLERSLTVPAVTEPAFGMAILAATGACSTEAATRMVRPGTAIEPRARFAGIYRETYGKLLAELEQRGWLPSELAAYSLARITA